MATRLLKCFILPLCLFTLIATGCTTQKPIDLVANGELLSRGSKSDLVELSAPQITRSGNNIIRVAGTVQRLPGKDEPIPGYVLLLVESPDGKVLDQLNISWNPREIPTVGDRSASYAVRWTYLPPHASVIRAVLSTRALVPDSLNGGSGVQAGGYGHDTIGTYYTKTPARSNQPGRGLSTPRQPGGGGRGW